MKQKDFAEVIEEPQYIVSDWINGRAKPGYESLKKMATKLNISADYLLGIIDTY
ncbi:MAG: helix-turn-helix transcriptional regulator [Clostridia bacterium]|nr:helix-turn-helix transcriptional regulator [Clostridia bacterium]